MAISKAILDSYISYGDAVLSALKGYEVPEGKAGIACARGTLIARLNSLRVISAGLETRESNAKDAFELKGMVSTLVWLASDTYVTKDFKAIELTILDTAFAEANPTTGITGETDFVSLITSLARSIEDVILA